MCREEEGVRVNDLYNFIKNPPKKVKNKQIKKGY